MTTGTPANHCVCVSCTLTLRLYDPPVSDFSGYPYRVKSVLRRCRRSSHRLRHLDLINFGLSTEFIRARGEEPGVNNLFTAGSVGSVQVMVAMLLLHVVVALQAAVVLHVAAPIHQRHRADRHGGRARSCSAAALHKALAEQRQLSAAACSSQWSLAHHPWMDSQLGGCVVQPSDFAWS